MSKDKDILSRFGANLAESMGAGRVAGAGEFAAAPGSPAMNAAPGPNRHDGTARLKSAAEIDLDRIAPDPSQPRTDFDEPALVRLAESLRAHGQLQPISVRWSEAAGRYLIVAGERRWRASKIAGRRTIAAIVVEGDRGDSQIFEMQLIENCLREDLRPIEQARAFQALMDRNAWTADRVAEVLHLSGASVSRALKLLDLPCTVQEAVESGALAPSVAYEVSKLADPTAQAEIAARVVAEDLSRAETVEVVRRATDRKAADPKAPGIAKGRGAASAKPKTSRVLKAAGYKITVENRRGVEDATLAAALIEILDQLRQARGEFAA